MDTVGTCDTFSLLSEVARRQQSVRVLDGLERMLIGVSDLITNGKHRKHNKHVCRKGLIIRRVYCMGTGAVWPGAFVPATPFSGDCLSYVFPALFLTIKNGGLLNEAMLLKLSSFPLRKIVFCCCIVIIYETINDGVPLSETMFSSFPYNECIADATCKKTKGFSANERIMPDDERKKWLSVCNTYLIPK